MIYTMNYAQTLEYIESLKAYGIVPGLGNITELCKRLGNPQDALSFVHIAGTNGKGSVLAYVSTILKCAGYKVGRYISPVIFDYCEKIQVGGRPISRKALCECMEEVKAACETMVADGFSQPTPFEVETAAAFLYFQKKECDIVVLETGMGGREDATNLIRNTKVAVLTSISMDHMQFLGKTLEKIAWQKAGIIKESCSVVSAVQEAEALSVIADEAKEKNCSLTIVKNAEKVRFGLEKQKFSYQDSTGTAFSNLEITLAGKHQIENAALAVEVIGQLALCGFPVSEKQLRKGLLETVWPGRFQIVAKRPLFILDGAHNEDAAKKLAESIRFYFTNKRIIYIMGILKDKEYEKVIAETYAYAEQIITVTPPDNPRALPALTLAQAVKEYHPHVTAAGSLEEAVEMAYLLAGKDDVIISFGSLSYLGRMMDILRKRQEK
ncbi:MAG: bifunctional folylpolyglutamate synthase/dihydrofolate synthase [Lachnospiraceae bacterium]